MQVTNLHLQGCGMEQSSVLLCGPIMCIAIQPQGICSTYSRVVRDLWQQVCVLKNMNLCTIAPLYMALI